MHYVTRKPKYLWERKKNYFLFLDSILFWFSWTFKTELGLQFLSLEIDLLEDIWNLKQTCSSMGDSVDDSVGDNVWHHWLPSLWSLATRRTSAVSGLFNTSFFYRSCRNSVYTVSVYTQKKCLIASGHNEQTKGLTKHIHRRHRYRHRRLKCFHWIGP